MCLFMSIDVCVSMKRNDLFKPVTREEKEQHQEALYTKELLSQVII
jgi:hypothetical protein